MFCEGQQPHAEDGVRPRGALGNYELREPMGDLQNEWASSPLVVVTSHCHPCAYAALPLPLSLVVALAAKSKGGSEDATEISGPSSAWWPLMSVV